MKRLLGLLLVECGAHTEPAFYSVTMYRDHRLGFRVATGSSGYTRLLSKPRDYSPRPDSAGSVATPRKS